MPSPYIRIRKQKPAQVEMTRATAEIDTETANRSSGKD